MVFDLEAAQFNLAAQMVRKGGTVLEYTINGIAYTVELACEVDYGNAGTYCINKYNDGWAYVIEIKPKDQP
jgi:hypothetical protein